MSISLQCEFWAVGQGLFSSGKVLSGGNTAFSWVYDCGTSSDQKILQCAIQEMKKDYPESELDLLVISHFDKDHINGIGNLLAQYQSVKRIMLPYYPLWQRLIIAKYLGISSEDNFWGFFIDPVSYILEKFPKINTVLLLPSGSDYIPNEAIDLNNVSNEFKFHTIKPLEEFKNTLGSKVKWLNPQSRYLINQVEFVPYNVPFHQLGVRPNGKNNFQQQVENIINVNSLNVMNLKVVYDNYFVSRRNKPINRNVISLFLYVAMLDDAPNRVISYTETANQRSGIIFSNNMHNTNLINKTYGDAIFYGGDGFLKTQKSLNNLCAALGLDRINNIACFQVMHHGSKHNWKAGLSPQIQPYIAIFPADPDYKYHHPHSRVVFDFIHNTPILIDKNNTLKIRII